MENKIVADSVLSHSMFEFKTTSKKGKAMAWIIVNTHQTMESNISEEIKFPVKG